MVEQQGASPDAVTTRIGQTAMLLHAGDRQEARSRFGALWEELGPVGDPRHRCLLAHYMADAQDDPRDELLWDLRALAAADGRDRGTGVRHQAVRERGAGREPGPEVGREPGWAAAPETGREPGWDTGRERGPEAGREPVREAGREPGTEAGREPGTEAGPGRGHEMGRERGHEPRQEAGRGTRPEAGPDAKPGAGWLTGRDSGRGAGLPAELRAFHPTLHLNIAADYLKLGRLEAARIHLRRASTLGELLADDGYAYGVRAEIARLETLLAYG